MSFVLFSRAGLGRLDVALRSMARLGAQWRSVYESELQAGERMALEIGFVLMIGVLSAGLELAQWPAWSAVVALAGYLAWTVLYSEATIQVTRWQLGRNQAPHALSAEPVMPPA